MKNEEQISPDRPREEFGFQISDRPIVPVRHEPEPVAKKKSSRLGEVTKSYGGNLFYVIARDPVTLFGYWDLDWRRIFAEANLSFRAVYLRVLRVDRSEELTAQVDPFVGQYFANVSLPGARYFCELGSFDNGQWKTLVRSETVATMDAKSIDDFETEFATLPLHLSFQRLLDTFRSIAPNKATLAQSIAKAQSTARALRANGREIKPADLGLGEMDHAEFAALFQSDAEAQSPSQLSPETVGRWKELAEPFGASSWGGSSQSAAGA